MRSAKTFSFCFSKEEKSRTFMGMVYHLIFLFHSCRLLNTILSFQKFASITESFILCLLGVILGVTLTVILGIILNFLSTFLHFLSTFSVHHLHNLTYLFIVLGFTLGFILGFILSYLLPLIPACIIYFRQ